MRRLLLCVVGIIAAGGFLIGCTLPGGPMPGQQYPGYPSGQISPPGYTPTPAPRNAAGNGQVPNSPAVRPH